MSDSKHAQDGAEPGDPIVDTETAETTPEAEDVVAGANDTLADAAAIAADTPPAAPEAEAKTTAEPVAEVADLPEPTEAEARAAAVAAAAMNDDDDTPWYDRPEVVAAAEQDDIGFAAGPKEPVEDDEKIVVENTSEGEPEEVADAPTVSLAPPVAPAPTAPAVEEQSAVLGAPNASTVFVQAPEPPRKRGNRGFSGVVALLATIIFAAFYLAALLLQSGLQNGMHTLTDGQTLADLSLGFLKSVAFWAPVAAFFVGFWLLGAILNTAKWGLWVIFGVFVGAFALAGHFLGALLAGPHGLWVTPEQALATLSASVLSIPGLVAFVVGRELPVWFGGWIARRGRRVIAQNIEDREEYERAIEAGPQLADQ